MQRRFVIRFWCVDVCVLCTPCVCSYTTAIATRLSSKTKPIDIHDFGHGVCIRHYSDATRTSWHHKIAATHLFSTAFYVKKNQRSLSICEGNLPVYVILVVTSLWYTNDIWHSFMLSIPILFCNDVTIKYVIVIHFIYQECQSLG